MPISFRTARNLGLGILLGIILLISALSYFTIDQTAERLKAIVTVEEARLFRYAETTELIFDAREYLYAYINEKSQSVSSIILTLDEALRRLEIIKRLSPSLEEERMLKEMFSGIRRFKTAVFSYGQEIKEGYAGSTSAEELKQIALESSQDTIQLVRAVSQAVREQIQTKHNQILKFTLAAQRNLALALILGIISTFFIALLMASAIAYPITQLITGTKELSKGNLNYQLNIATNHEFGPITTAFNRMIQDLKHSREEILRSKEILTRVTEGIEEGLMLLDANFKILWGNKKIMEASHLKESEVVGNCCYHITHHREEPCEPPDDICPISEVLKTKAPVTVVHTHFDKDGNKFFAEVSAYPLKDETGQITQFIHVSRDITRRLELEQKLKENIRNLESSQAELQKKVEELEKVTKLAVDRELRMVELKQKIKELEGAGKGEG